MEREADTGTGILSSVALRTGVDSVAIVWNDEQGERRIQSGVPKRRAETWMYIKRKCCRQDALAMNSCGLPGHVVSRSGQTDH